MIVLRKERDRARTMTAKLMTSGTCVMCDVMDVQHGMCLECVWSLWGPGCAAVGVVWFWLVIVMTRMMVGDGNGIGG